MPISDREKWNAKYLETQPTRSPPSAVVTSLGELIPNQGRALDLAGGNGRHAIWLAQRGLDVTLVDISEVAVEQAAEWARDEGLSICALQLDLEEQPLPEGPWDLVLSVLFLWRPLYQRVASLLEQSGRFICVHPTRRNLQRHSKPPERFLLQESELPKLVRGLQTVYYREGWLTDGRHDAVLVAERT